MGDADDLSNSDIFPAEAFTLYYENVRPVLLRDKVWTGPLPVRVEGGAARMMTVTVVAGVGPGGEIEWLVAHGRELLEELEVKGARTMTTSSVDPMAHELAYAVSQGRIAPHVQAVVDVRSRDVVGYQGLARWRHRTRGLLEAAAFIDLVADSPTAPVIDLAVIRDTAAVAARGAAVASNCVCTRTFRAACLLTNNSSATSRRSSKISRSPTASSARVSRNHW